MRKTFQSRRWLAALLTLALVMSLAPVALAAGEGNIVLSTNNLTLEIGATETLSARFSISGTPDSVTWTSNNTNVATVNGGVVTAVNAGQATITAKAGNGTTDTCEVTVTTPTLNLSDTSLSLKIGGNKTLTATLSNGNKPQSLTWSSNNTNAVTVDTNGKVEVVGYSESPVTITATTGNKATATCEVTIIAPTITITPANLEVGAGTTSQEVVASVDEIVKVNGVAWGWMLEPVSSDTRVTIASQRVSDDRKQFLFSVRAPKEDPLENHLNIIYGPYSGSSIDKNKAIIKEYVVKVNSPEILFPKTLTMTVGGQETLQAQLGGTVTGAGTWKFTVTPSDLLGYTENTDSGTIVLTAKKNNTATVRVDYLVGGESVAWAECTVTITPYEEPQIAPIQNIEMVEGETRDITAVLTPAGMAGTWTWTIENPNLADGGISFVDNVSDEQTVKITAAPLHNASSTAAQKVTVNFASDTKAPISGMKDEDSQTFYVTVKQADRKVELDPAELELNILQDNSAQVKVTVMKGGQQLSEKDAKITYDTDIKDSLGRKIAEVSGDGTADISGGTTNLTITPLGTGEGTLTVKHTYGGNLGMQTVKQGTCKITITGPSIKLDKTSMELDLVGNQNGELTATLEPSGTLANVKWEVFMPMASDPNKPSKRPTDVISITHDRTGHCLVRAEKNGRAVIVATYQLAGDVSGTITAQCVVEVGEYHFSISPDTNQLKEPGEYVDIAATISRSGKTDSEVMENQEKNIRWQISDSTIARIDGVAPGVSQVFGKKSIRVYGRDKNSTGTVTVTATWDYTDKKGNKFFEQRSIDIIFANPEPDHVNFTLNPATFTMATGAERTLSISGGTLVWKDNKSRPAPSDFKPTYTYASSDTKVATVDRTTGKVTAIGAGEATITATAAATANGKAVSGTATAKVTVTVDISVKSIKLSANSISLDVGGRQTVTATTDPAGAAVTWSSSNEKVATVNNGEIVAVGPGTATITAAAGGHTAQVTVTVNGLEQLLDEITVVEGKSVSVDTLFKAHGAAAGRNPTYSSLDPTVASYANGAIVGNKVGNTSITIASGTYRIAVKVTVVADASSTIELPTMYTQTQPILRFRDFIARFRPQAGGSLSHIVGLNVDTAKGTLYYNYTSANEPGMGVGADNYYLSPTVGQRGIEDITFVPKPNYSGRVTINYTAVSTGGQNYVCSIVFDVDPGSGSGSGINLSTPYNTPLKFSGADFNRVCQDRLGVRLDYVTFSQPSSQQGTLYTNYVSAGNYGSVVSGSSQYTTKALDDVWFVPAPGFSGSVTVYYTGYGVGGASFSGQVSISVGWENNVAIGGLTYDINRGGVAYFDDFRFSSYCRQVLDSSKSLSHIRFTSLPASSEGVLYYNYNSSSRTQASTGTNYYYSSSSPYIDRLAFAAASGFTGTVKIPFTGWTTDGVSFTGNVEINVQGGGSSGTSGDILYICGAGQTAYFDDTDFNMLSRNRTGSSLNYITFDSLPGSSYGSVYYNNSRATTSASYRNGSSTPRIDNLSFRASNSFYGAVDIPFTGRATNGETFRGVITVASSSSVVNNGNAGASQTVFTDMSGYSAAQQAAVNYLYEHNITRGMTTTQFGPQNSIRRGDFARMVYQAFDLTPSASSRPFQDVPNTAYYAQAVNALYSRGIVSGIGGGLYNPDGTLTRQDAICMVQRAMRAVGWSADDGSISSLYRYSDGGAVSGYAQGAMAFAVDRGILPTGGSWLNPTQPLTRVDMAEIIYRVLSTSGY